jgi:hypothetical protein
MRVAFVLSLLFLAACVGRPDSLAPIITITEPPTGTVQRAEGLTVTGYALDDSGIAAIRVNGSANFLDNPGYQNERGNKLVQFWFQPGEIQAGQRTFTIEVEDVSGRVSTLDYVVQIDTEPPVIEIDRIEFVAGNQLRVSGLVRDNDRVARIAVNDEELPFSPVEQRRFSVTIPRAEAVRVVAYDQAGNRAVAEETP